MKKKDGVFKKDLKPGNYNSGYVDNFSAGALFARVLKCAAVFCGVSFSLIVCADQSASPVATIPAAGRFSFELVNMPDNKERKMGLVGVNYLLDFNEWFYGGVAGYGAASGERGGLFVLGFEAGVKHQLFSHFIGNAGIYAGGGGGRTSLVGGGLMLRPHAGIAYDFDYFQLGLDLSKVRFPDGAINSTQVALNLTIPTSVTYDANFNPRLNHVTYVNPEQSFIFTQYYISLLGQT